MGVPGFFSWLTRHYKNSHFIMPKLPNGQRVKILYLDANCLFHPQCFKVLENLIDEKNPDILEDKMIKRILNYVSYIIGFVNPEDMVFFSVDGPAPRAKIDQQRKRRFRSIDDNAIKAKIKAKYGIKSNNAWNNTVITPGTQFMEKLHLALKKYFSELKGKSKLQYIYSSYHTPGEGEHKILQHIKSLIKKYGLSAIADHAYAIYGLDADLFFLAIASQKKNIYLVRETTELNSNKKVENKLLSVTEDVAEELNYVSIDITKECYNEQITNLVKMRIDQYEDQNQVMCKLDKNVNFCDDFVFLCYLLGNDFLPHFPSINIKRNGLDIILDIYCDIYIRTNEQIIHLNHERKAGERLVKFNMDFVNELIHYLGTCEYDYFTITLQKSLIQNSRRTCPVTDEYAKEMWNLENLRDVKIHDPIKLGHGQEKDWKFRYYDYYYGSSEYQNILIDELCRNYIDGLVWTADYYFDTCTDWLYQYMSLHAPFISDVTNYLKKTKLDLNKITFEPRKPLAPCVQLLSVLPPACAELLPHTYRWLVTSDKSPIIDMFPQEVKLDMINKDQFWQCVPLIPALDIERVQEQVAKLKLTPQEEITNKELGEFIY